MTKLVKKAGIKVANLPSMMAMWPVWPKVNSSAGWLMLARVDSPCNGNISIGSNTWQYEKMYRLSVRFICVTSPTWFFEAWERFSPILAYLDFQNLLKKVEGKV